MLAFNLSDSGTVNLSAASYGALAKYIESGTQCGMLTDFDGAERKMNFQPVPDTNWYMVNFASMKVMNNDLNQLYFLAVALAVVVIVLAILVIRVLTRKYFRAFTQLTSEILVFSKGTLDNESEVQANSREFNASESLNTAKEITKRSISLIGAITDAVKQEAVPLGGLVEELHKIDAITQAHGK